MCYILWYCVLIRCNKMQQYAGIYLRQVYSTCFGSPSSPSSGVQKIVIAASGTGHSNGATTFLQRGLIRFCGIMHPRCCWPAKSWVHYTTSCNTQSSAPEDGQNNCPKHSELIGIINKLLLLRLVSCLCYLYQRCTVKQISNKYIYVSQLWHEGGPSL